MFNLSPELEALISQAVAEDNRIIPQGKLYAVAVFVSVTGRHYTSCIIGDSKDDIRQEAIKIVQNLSEMFRMEFPHFGVYYAVVG